MFTKQTYLHNHYVYFNLHKRLWSLRSSSRLVSGHAERVLLFDTTCKVSQAGRARVIREKRKNVHAGIIGKHVFATPNLTIVTTEDTRQLRYNPYDLPYFHDRDNRHERRNPTVVYLDSGRAYYGNLFILAGCTGFLNRLDFHGWLNETGYTGDVIYSDGSTFYSRRGFLQRAG